MKRHILYAFGAGVLLLSSCIKDKSSNNNPALDFNTLKKQVLSDFTTNIALTNYKDLDDDAHSMYNTIQTLNTNTTEDNLTAARNSWKNLRTSWEQCEGFLFGPVEDNNFDPNMDTWPTDYNQLDSLLASGNPLGISDIQQLTLSLRGFHPIEYVIFGKLGDARTATNLTAREKTYMVSLATDVKTTCDSLYQSWVAGGGNFAAQVVSAGTPGSRYVKQQDAYLAIVGAMTDICDEVGNGKMKEPYDAKDPNLVESPYSSNSLIDFKNNIIGLQNVYLGKYKGNSGYGLKDLVAAKNKSLDNTIQSQIAAAISSFNNISVPYEQAIITQRPAVQQTMAALNTLKETLDGQLVPFIMTNITD